MSSSVATLLLLLIISVTILLIKVGYVQAQAVGPDGSPLEGPVCSFCDCRYIPLANASTAANALVVDVVSKEWMSFSMHNYTKSSFGMFFRGSNASCRVEIKLTEFHSPWNDGLLLFPYGRQNLTVFQRSLTNAACSPYSSSFLRLGKSAFSIRNELGLQVVIPTWDVVHLNLIYRQWCDSSLPEAQGGFELPPVSADGSAVTANLSDLLDQAAFAATDTITWKIARPLNCALEITFQRVPVYTYLNELVRVIPWMVYKLTGVAVSIDVTGAFYPGKVTSLEVSYRAVDCRSNSQGIQIEIVSWNDSLIPFDYSKNWQKINRTSSNALTAPRSVNLAVFFAATPSWPGDTVPLVIENNEFTGYYSRGIWPSPFYANEFNRTFGGRLLKDTVPIVRFFEHSPYQESGQSFVALRYRAVARSRTLQPKSDRWRTIKFSTATFLLELRPSDVSCFIQARLDLPPDFYDFEWPYTSFLLDPTSASGSISQDVNAIVQSQTGSLIMRTTYNTLPANPTISYRQVCPEILRTRSMANHHSNWSYSIVSVDKHPVFVLAPLAMPLCRYQISGIGLRISGMSNLQVLCLSLNQTTTLTQRSVTFHSTLSPFQSVDLANCAKNGANASVYIHAAPSWSLFAYRITCDDGDVGSSSMAPYPAAIGPVSRATSDKWRILKYSNLELPLTLMAAKRDCHVEIEFAMVDLLNVAIYEEFVHPEDDYFDASLFKNLPVGYGKAQLGHIRYTSCTSRVFLKAGPRPPTMPIIRNTRFRQVCNLPESDQCVRELVYNVSNSEWQTLQGSAINPNQMTHTSFRLFPVFTSADQVMELEFTSLVSQIWMGGVDGRYGPDTISETHHGIMIDHRYPAQVGKQFMFKHDVTLTPDALLNIKPGDHWFTLRYRIVQFEVAKRERDLGEVLIATNKPQELTFRIPKQFSQARARKDTLETFWDDYYGESGAFDIWAYKHRYTIKPKSADCRVVIRFKKIDIGPGYISGRPHSATDQSRLSVVRESAGLKSEASKECASSLRHNFTNGNWTEPVCVRLGQTYVSPRNNASFAIFFRSAKIYEEYEYDSKPDSRIKDHMAFQTTWGSGWIATYSQICSQENIPQSLYPAAVVLKARSDKWKPFKIPMPVHFIKGSNPTLRSFLDERWVIIPEDQDRCHIRFRVTVKPNRQYREGTRSLGSYDSRNGQFRYLTYSDDFEQDQVVLVLAREVYQDAFPNVWYTQVCSPST